MADLSIIAANFVIDTALPYTVESQYFAGAAVTAGQAVYLDTADGNKLKLSGAGGTAILATTRGIATHAAAIGQPVTVLRKGTFTVGATVAVGTRQVLSATAGSFALETDLVTTNRVTHGFEPISTTKAFCDFIRAGNATGVAHA